MTVIKKTTPYHQFFMVWVVIGLIFSGIVFDPASRALFLPVRQLLLSLWLLIGTLGFSLTARKGTALSRQSLVFLVTGGLLISWSFLSTLWAFNQTEAILTSNRALLQIGLITFFLLFSTFLLQQIHLLSRILTLWLFLLSLLGGFQYLDWTSFPFYSNTPPIGLSGNRNLFGSTLILLLPWALHLFLIEKRIWSIVGLLSLGTGTLALMLSQTRSAWVALAVAFTGIQILLIISRKRLSPQLRQRWKVANLSLAGTVSVIIALLMLNGQHAELKDNLKNRLASLVEVPSIGEQPGNEAERNILDRFHLWQHTLELIEDAPIEGVGAGNWKIQFPKYGGSAAPRFEDKDKLRVRPHNEYLRITSELGLVGLLLFLTLFGTAAFSAFKTFMHTEEELKLVSSIILIAISLGLAVDFFFSFALERMGHSYLIAINVALALQLSAIGAKHNLRQWVLTGILAAASILAATLSYPYWQANRSLHKLLRAEVSGQWERAASISLDIEQMPLTSLDPIGDPIEWHSANALKQMGKLDAALAKINQAIDIHPNSHRVWNTKAAILIQQEQFTEAIPALQTALELAPDYEPALSNLGYTLYRTDQFEQAITTLLSLDLVKHAKLLPVIWDAGQRVEKKWLNGSKIYQVGLGYLKSTPPLPATQWPAKVQSLRKYYASDEQFVKAYFETLEHYATLKAWQEKQPPASVMRLRQALGKVMTKLKEKSSFTALADQIIINDHLQTLQTINELPETKINQPEDLLFPL